MSEQSKVRILHVVDGFRVGGAETKLAELIERLDRDRFSQYLANVGPGGPLSERFKNLGVPLFECRRRFRFDWKPVFCLRRILEEHQIDIVQTTLFWADMSGMLAARLAGTPVTISWETVTHEGDPYHASLQRKLGYQFVVKNADAVVAVSHEIKDSLIRRRGMPADRIHVIHYGVDLEKYRQNGTREKKRQELGISPAELLIAVVARLEPVKGHRHFVEAFRSIAAEHAEARAVFVGDGSQREALQQQVQQAGLQDRIRFLGIRKDVGEILNAADFFVLPSVAGEGLPNVVLEAMACAKPVIATRIGGTPEAVLDGENGFIVEPGDAESLAHAMSILLRDGELREHFSRNSRQRAEQEFSLQKQLAAFEELYLRLLGREINQPAGALP